MTSTQPAVRRLLAALYIVGLLIVVDQCADLIVTIMASRPSPSTATWRFGVFGLIASRMSVLLLGDVLLFAAAVALEHRVTLRVLGWIHLALGTAAIVGLGLFGLDTLQVRGQLAVGRAGDVYRAAFRAGGVVTLGAGVALWAGVTALRSARRPGRSSHRTGETTPLMTSVSEGREAR